MSGSLKVLCNWAVENQFSALGVLMDLDFILDHNQAITLPISLGSRGGAVVRPLASHQCGPGLNPGLMPYVG